MCCSMFGSGVSVVIVVVGRRGGCQPLARAGPLISDSHETFTTESQPPQSATPSHPSSSHRTDSREVREVIIAEEE